ncbi:MAG: hypothetical protein Fur0018_19870 [Anaerolineales bacterium]
MTMSTIIRISLITWLAAWLLTGCAGMSNKPAPLAEPADPQALPALEGDYAINGTDMTDAAYGGTLHIDPGIAPHTYSLTWLLTESIQEGGGHTEGNQLIARWQSQDGSLSGTVTYTITIAGQLDGIRTIDGVSGESRERGYPNR